MLVTIHALVTSKHVHYSLKHKTPVFAFQIMQNTLSCYWAKFTPAGGIFAQFYWTFRGAFPLRWATASLVADRLCWVVPWDQATWLALRKLRTVCLFLLNNSDFSGYKTKTALSVCSTMLESTTWPLSIIGRTLFRSIVCAVDACPADFQSRPHIVGTQSIRKTSLAEATTVSLTVRTAVLPLIQSSRLVTRLDGHVTG